MSAYSRGAAFERRVRKKLEDEGYWVMRAAGSKGPADLVAIKAGIVLVVQCKKDGYASSRERERLRAVSTIRGVRCAIAWSPKRGVIELKEVK